MDSGEEIFAALLKTLSDSSDEVVRLDLQLLAQISNVDTTDYFTRMVQTVTSLFSTDRTV